MRRIAVATLLFAALAGAYWACSTDAPTPTTPQPGGTKSTPLVITLFTTNANPTAGSCTLIQAVATYNGQAVPDGTGIAFSSDFGIFEQNGTPAVSIVTQKGSAVTALCSSVTGTGFVTASATVNGASAKSAQLKIVFQSAALPVPFFTSCLPSFGTNAGGTTLTINGGNFSGSASSATVTFTAAGITRQGLVTNETPTSVTVVTPAFPEATAPSVPVTITLNLGGITFTVPNCFAFGTASASTPTVTALLPSSGTSEGGTRVSIIGSGFAAPVQVFIGLSEAQVVSVTYNQIVFITPLLTGVLPAGGASEAVRVHEVASGVDSNTSVAFLYLEPMIITAVSNNAQAIGQPFTTVTIFGRGFQAPVAVDLANFGAIVTSVSATEIQVIPGPVLFDPATNCTSNITGPVSVVNIDTGNGATSSIGFTYVTVGTRPCFTPTPTNTPPPTNTPTPTVTLTPT